MNVDKLVEYIQALQKEDGSFQGDQWGKLKIKVWRCFSHGEVTGTKYLPHC